MSERIRILQLGTQDWSKVYNLPEYVDWKYMPTYIRKEKKPYDMVFLDGTLTDEEVKELLVDTKAYTLYVAEGIVLNKRMQEYFDCRKGQFISRDKIQEFLLQDVRNFFDGSYGEKFRLNSMTVAQGFAGSVKWHGNQSVELNGDYGEQLHQVASWRNNIPVYEKQVIELWLEYEKDEEVEIALSVTQFVMGSVSEVQQTWYFTEEELQDLVFVDNQMPKGFCFISLLAKGNGKLKIIALHDRHSRRGFGSFLPGGERFVTSDRQEIFAYFNPGDMKPPLNVYFSGYKTRQGFEGYYLMRKMGSPFLLIAEPRLEGGSFYMGSSEYESLMVEIIRKYMNELGFTGEQVIMSGLSMGTFGALYYGCDIKSKSIIIGKPLASIGDVACNERIHRPGGFPTSLDVLAFIEGDTDDAAVNRLNSRFWDKFDKADWSRTKFIVSYMIEDDYDSTAYNTLISHLSTEGVQVYGKGIHGRHNDATGAIVSWFTSQYEKILMEDYGRRIVKK